MRGSNAYSDDNNSDSENTGGNVMSKPASKKSVSFDHLPGDKPRMVGTGSNKYTKGSDDNYDIVEITLDVRDGSVALHEIMSVTGTNKLEEDPEMTHLAKKMLEKRSSPSGSNVFKNTSNKFHQMSHELKRLESLSRKTAAPGRLDRSKSVAAQPLAGLKFIATTEAGLVDWNYVEKKFDELTLETNGLLPSSEFGKCIGMSEESNGFAEEMFTALARRFCIKRNSINKEELSMFWTQISDDSFDSRLQTFFDMVDKDADGRVTEAEIAEIIRLSASANNLSTIQEQAEEYAAMIMEELDPDNIGYIMMFSLEALLMQNATQRSSQSKDLSRLLSQRMKSTVETNPVRKWYQKRKDFVMDNWQRVWVMTLWLVILAGLFAYKFVENRNNAAYNVMGYCLCTAKGAAETLKFNMALILLPVCRNTVTWLRNKTKLGVAVPFDDNINFHKVIAIAISVGVVLHAGAHLTCDFPRLLHATKEEYEPLKRYFGEEQPDNYLWFVKGVEGVTGIIMVVLMAIAFTLAATWFRKNKLADLLKKIKLPDLLKKLRLPDLLKKLRLPDLLKKLQFPDLLKKLTGFNAFWYSHHLFVIVYTLLIVHGYYLYLTHIWYQKTTWMYLAVPVLLYGCERLIRAFRSSSTPVRILDVCSYPGKVFSLQMSKPQGFEYSSGQYMFVKCRDVSTFEWHPFSITSAPLDDYLSVHIRAVGDWTEQLRTEFIKVCNQAPSELMQGETNPKYPRMSIDGPYGAPAQEYKKYEVVILVGLGIGATPMVSIVKDIINNLQNITRDEEEGGQTPSTHTSPSPFLPSTLKNTKKKNDNTFKTRRAYFYWVTKEQGTFDWFRNIMNEVADMDTEGRIELHNYCSSVYEEGDARSAIITMLQSLHHAKKGVDVVAGTRVKTHFAKPNWRKVFKNVANHHADTLVGVFYCGLPLPAKELKELALEFSHKTTTKFEFHKENF